MIPIFTILIVLLGTVAARADTWCWTRSNTDPINEWFCIYTSAEQCAAVAKLRPGLCLPVRERNRAWLNSPR